MGGAYRYGVRKNLIERSAIMKVFRELTISGPPDVLQETVVAIERRLDNGWYRDTKAEELFGTGQEPMYCFACVAFKGRPAADVWLMYRPSGSLSVSNIIPHEGGQLSYDDYNRLLQEFHESFVAPLQTELSLHITLTEGEKGLSAWLSRSAADLLDQFIRAGNRYAPTAHQEDRNRWDAFLVAAHRDRAALDAKTLHRWLIEEVGWPEEAASDLAADYSSGRALLEYYDTTASLVAS